MDMYQDANNYMQKANKITQTFPEILAICCFRELWGVADYIQIKRHDHTVASMDM